MALDYRFTPAFENPTGSAIRELFKYLSLPGMISFAGGYPAAAFFDQAGLQDAAEQAMRETPLDCLQYAATEGLQRGDVILQINQQPTPTPAAAAAAVAAARKAGKDTVLMLVQRGAIPARFIGIKLQPVGAK